MTNQSSQFPRFYVTAPHPCPYLEDRLERKIFTEINEQNPEGLHESLAKVGFRRSQDIAYRPNCENCAECKSVRIPVNAFTPSRTQRRLINLNADLVSDILPNKATQEHYDLLSRYLAVRHAEGGMVNMSYDEYEAMVECSPISTNLIEYRLPATSDAPGKLIAVCLTDSMSDSISMVYSFFDVSPDNKKRSIGTYLVLDHVARAQVTQLSHVYLGYWVKESPKMAYKMKFKPLEVLSTEGWHRATA
ncbi:arginyltransferase [Paremcibacter congregatus]|uniref:Aspartate/glutamate leucyltransferase n=1 Tax=Paremcibacter congregatus TaxID=2043170 RepID=A0A2G4YN50_9PROT|nr:arginyltransferase [Paremcibacter congregatus]PHZ83725.1 arginyltransferase [Paremcibacter congregatus]QDE27426.1 arginyltransferase [Paremcibacter congregatus]